MANVCTFHMVVRGSREACVKLFSEGMRQCYDACIIHEYGTDEEYTMRIDGECRWSVKNSFISDDCEDGSFINKTLEEKSRILQLEVEIVGYDIGEPEWLDHYHYKNGECLRESCPPLYFFAAELEEYEECPYDLSMYDFMPGDGVYVLKDEYAEPFEFSEERETMIFTWDMSFEQPEEEEEEGEEDQAPEWFREDITLGEMMQHLGLSMEGYEGFFAGSDEEEDPEE